MRRQQSPDPMWGGQSCPQPAFKPAPRRECNVNCQRFGKHRNDLQRFRCPQCKRTFTEPHELTLGEMYIPMERIILAVKLLLERSTERITGLDHNTIMKLLVLAGEKCEKVMENCSNDITFSRQL